jgi:transcriptional pleiotropic regulator of transition state genes
MKSTGIVRELDTLNRLVIPMEIVKGQNLQGASMEILTEGENIVIRKFQPGCRFCGSIVKLKNHMGTLVCQGCIDELSKYATQQSEQG